MIQLSAVILPLLILCSFLAQSGTLTLNSAMSTVVTGFRDCKFYNGFDDKICSHDLEVRTNGNPFVSSYIPDKTGNRCIVSMMVIYKGTYGNLYPFNLGDTANRNGYGVNQLLWNPILNNNNNMAVGNGGFRQIFQQTCGSLLGDLGISIGTFSWSFYSLQSEANPATEYSLCLTEVGNGNDSPSCGYIKNLGGGGGQIPNVMCAFDGIPKLMDHGTLNKGSVVGDLNTFSQNIICNSEASFTIGATGIDTDGNLRLANGPLELNSSLDFCLDNTCRKLGPGQSLAGTTRGVNNSINLTVKSTLLDTNSAGVYNGNFVIYINYQ